MLFHYLPRKMKQLERTQNGELILNHDNLKTICLIEGLYEYPDMNSKLYLQYKVIGKLQGLDQYINIKALYLDNNVIKKIQNLNCLPHLQSLFLQNNMIKVIQNLQCPQLKILNLSYNQIKKIQSLSHLNQLQSLSLSHNYLETFQSIQHLSFCSPTLTNLDLSSNTIVGHQQLYTLFQTIKCLYLQGNPLVREIRHYRRHFIGKLPQLLYLDERTIDNDQRLLSQGWVNQGEAGFSRAKEQIIKMKHTRKAERSQQIMKNINFHRNAKIMLFKRSIQEAKLEIKKLQCSITNTNQNYYQNKIQEEYKKINEYYDLIIGIQKRMGNQVLTVKDFQFLSNQPVVVNQIEENHSVRSSSNQSTEPIAELLIEQQENSNKSQEPFEQVSSQSDTNSEKKPKQEQKTISFYEQLD